MSDLQHRVERRHKELIAAVAAGASPAQAASGSPHYDPGTCPCEVCADLTYIRRLTSERRFPDWLPELERLADVSRRECAPRYHKSMAEAPQYSTNYVLLVRNKAHAEFAQEMMAHAEDILFTLRDALVERDYLRAQRMFR